MAIKKFNFSFSVYFVCQADAFFEAITRKVQWQKNWNWSQNESPSQHLSVGTTVSIHTRNRFCFFFESRIHEVLLQSLSQCHTCHCAWHKARHSQNVMKLRFLKRVTRLFKSLSTFRNLRVWPVDTCVLTRVRSSVYVYVAPPPSDSGSLFQQKKTQIAESYPPWKVWHFLEVSEVKMTLKCSFFSPKTCETSHRKTAPTPNTKMW